MLDAAAGHYAGGRLEEAARLYLKVERADPQDVRARYSLAVIDLRRGLHEPARRRLRGVVRRLPGDYAARHNLGVAEQALGDWDAAAAAYAAALALKSDAVETAFSLAIALTVTGRLEEAVGVYRALSAQAGARLRALTRLALIQPVAIMPADVAELQAAMATATTPSARVAACFALAEVRQHHGETDEAFDLFAQGNRLHREGLAQGPVASRPAAVAAEHSRSVARIQRLFTQEFISAYAGAGERQARPIFIVGMPRSGSTLIEQILASHPAVQAMGESEAMSRTVEGRFPYPPEAPRAADHFRRVARDYGDAQKRRGWDGRRRMVDKTLDNHLHVGLIHLTFPNAVILHVRRDPRDVGLACFRQLFAEGHETLYDLAEIGAEILRYDAIMAHWREVLPGRVTEVDYETLVADPETQIRRLVVETCGLSWREACLDFHRASRPVGTASAVQVRQPIFTSSIGRWRQVEDRLAPLLAVLAREDPAATSGDSGSDRRPDASPAASSCGHR